MFTNVHFYKFHLINFQTCLVIPDTLLLIVHLRDSNLSLYISYIDVIDYVLGYSMSAIFGCLRLLFVVPAAYAHLPPVSGTFIVEIVVSP